MAESSKTRKVFFKPGDIIIRDKSPGLSLFIINKGQVHVFKENSKGEQVTLGIVSSGEYLGEVALLSETNHRASAEALSEVECVEISSQAIQEQLKTVPKWLVALTRGLMDRLIRANETIKKHNLMDPQLSEKVKAIKSKYPNQGPA